MSFETGMAEIVKESKKVFDLVTGQFIKWDGQVKAQIKSLDDWKNGFKSNQSLPMPLNYNAFMHDLGNGALEDWGRRGSVVIEAVSPLTKAFEGPYVSSKPQNAVDHEDIAGADAPFYFGRYNKGPRVSRGGLYDGWGGLSGGHILKIYKPAGDAHTYANSCIFQMIETFKRRKFNFRAYVYVAKGPLSFDLGLLDDGGQINIPSAKQWHFIDVIVGESEVCSTYMNINIDHADECELYIAMMNITPVANTGNASTIINRRIK